MSKSFKKSRRNYDDDNEDVDLRRKKQLGDRRKMKKMKNDLRARNVDRYFHEDVDD